MGKDGLSGKKIECCRETRTRDHVHRFELGGEVVPSLVEAPVNRLGRWYMVKLNDVGRVEEVKNKLLRGLRRIDGCGLPGKLKIWCLKFGIMPRVLWPLMT